MPHVSLPLDWRNLPSSFAAETPSSQANPVDPNFGSQFEIQVVIPSDEGATIKDAGTYSEITSNIYSNGYSDEFTLNAGDVFNVSAGIIGNVVNPFTVTTLTDRAPLTGGVGNGRTGDLRYCITQAMMPQNAGSVIVFQASLNGGTLALKDALPELSQTVYITGNVSENPITIQGQGDATNPYRIFTVQQNVNAVINYLTITGGFDNSFQGGGGIENEGKLALIGGVISENKTTLSGGGISNNQGATLLLTNDEVSYQNTAPKGGGIFNAGKIVASSTSIFDNDATNGDGGGIYNDGDDIQSAEVQLKDGVQISGNKATGNGGGVYNNAKGIFTMDGGQLSYNAAGNVGQGGGLYSEGAATLDQGLTVEGNSANQGGGLRLQTGSTTAINTITVDGNKYFGTNPIGKGILQANGAMLNPAPVNLTDNDDPNGPVQG